jgi:membrane-bound lytic murein transglycosylase D
VSAKKIFGYVIICVSLILFSLIFIFGTQKAKDNYNKDFRESYRVYSPAIPESLSFSAEPVPLYLTDVRERLDRELLLNVYWQSQTLMFIKRANRYFPLVESILKKNGIPDDFKYIALVESGFQNVVSNAAAVGFWQFMEPTAKHYGLEVNEEVDERYNIYKSTEAICKFFKDGYAVFGNWTLVAASFNMGIAGIRKQVEQQQVSSFYDLYLNSETSRYVFRILAVKEILEHPEKYGYFLLKEHLYPPLKTYNLCIDSTIKDLYSFAFSHNASYKDIKTLNPWLRKSYLTNKSRKAYFIDLPLLSGNKDSLVRDTFTSPVQFNKSNNLNYQDEDSLIVHLVKENETILDIARKYKVRVPQILQWNDMEGYYIKKGQKLKIYISKNVKK